MQISAINNTNLKSNFKGIEEKNLRPFNYNNFDVIDVEPKEIIDIDTPAKGYNSPIKFFAATAALAIASYIAVKKASFVSIKKLEGKFPLFNSLDSIGKALNKKYTNWQKAMPKVEGKNFKTYMQNIANKLLKYGEDVAKNGVTAVEKKAYRGHVRDLYAKNGLRKIISSVVGGGAAALTMARRYKDSDKNGIPDKLDKKQGTTLDKIQDAMEAIPTIAAAAANLA